MLRRVRAVVGEDAPIVISLDYHANVSAQMVQHADAILPYWTYPHVDQFDTGKRAAVAMQRLLVDGRPKGRALRHLPFLLPLNFQCTLVEPSKGIVEAAAARLSDYMLSLAYLAGFPPGDLRECGPTVSAHAIAKKKPMPGRRDRAIDQGNRIRRTAFAARRRRQRSHADCRWCRKAVVIADQDNPRWHRGHGRDVGGLSSIMPRMRSSALSKIPTSRLWRTKPASEPS